jgi:hypothetical protein
VDPKRFWDLIGFARRQGTSGEEWHDALVEQLSRLPPEDIVGFERTFQELYARASTPDLLDAAYRITGLGSDALVYFRCWLIGMGKQVYESAVPNPDSLADVVNPDEDCEEWNWDVALHAREQSTGLTEKEFYEELNRLGPVQEKELQSED